MKTAVIIPAYNEAATIACVVKSVIPHVGAVIVVDDGSNDSTGSKAHSAGADVVRNELSRGYDGAIQRGFERAAELGIDVVVTMDADGQHPAAKLPSFLVPLQKNQTDMVFGLRPRTARLAEAIFGLYTRLRFNVPDILCGMKSYRMDIFHKHGCFDSTKSIGTELAIWAMKKGYRHQKVPIPIEDRKDSPRFGNGFKANLRIAAALIRVIRLSI